MSVAEQNLTDRITYADLYRRWEENNWSATGIDFGADKAGWDGLTEMQRKSAIWIYSLFFFGEDSVADNLSPYIDAAPTEEQRYFLATQQVDEARHAVFFHRFFKEVIGAGDDLPSTLAYTEQFQTWGYRMVFERLDRMAEELRRDRSLPKYAQAITLYHLVVEATLAQPGQHFIEDFFIKDGTMPGFSEGMKNVSRDEQRHIGFGVKVLNELLRESDEVRAAIEEILEEVMRYTSSVLIPPGWDMEYLTCYGFDYLDIAEWGITSLEHKWRAIGHPMEDWKPQILPVDLSLPPRERAETMMRLTRAGLIGESMHSDQMDRSPEMQALYFDVVTRSIDPTLAGAAPFTIRWEFSDVDPWTLRIEGGEVNAEAGANGVADVTLETNWHDFIELGKGEISPPVAMLQRKLRVHGGPRNLLRFRKLFG